MSTILGALRRRFLAPDLVTVTTARRGFPAGRTAVTDRLERVPQAVICGFEWGLDTSGLWETERRLSLVEPDLRGFAYEGATMACSILDAMPGRGGRTRELLLGPGHPHIFLAYIGVGFAMARLPRARWKSVLPDLSGSPYHPTMSWLAVDGYGFDRAFFETRRWVDEQRQPSPYPWQGCPAYFPRAVDQGIGRALWFIHGARTRAVTDAVLRFPEHRQPDLWSGVGLAATFAGGGHRAGLTQLCADAGAHWTQLALGAVFAIKARAYASFVPEHSASACRSLTGLPVAAAVELADGTAVDSPGPDGRPAYEMWREGIRSGLDRGAPGGVRTAG